MQSTEVTTTSRAVCLNRISMIGFILLMPLFPWLFFTFCAVSSVAVITFYVYATIYD